MSALVFHPGLSEQSQASGKRLPTVWFRLRDGKRQNLEETADPSAQGRSGRSRGPWLPLGREHSVALR